jgi:nucleoside-diphosphate-sugar epimerase
MGMEKRKIHIVTGASGFIGRHLVEQLHGTGNEVAVLIRPLGGLTSQERAEKIFPFLAGTPRFHIISGDVTSIDCGVDWRIVDEMLQNADVTIWHLAANLSFSPKKKSEAEHVNVGGTKNVVAFANVRASRLVYVSTAYVCGTAIDLFGECDLDVGQRFRNHYEATKFAAEKLVRSQGTIPFIIFRPSIVIGDAYEGKAEGCTFGYYRFGFMLHVFKRWILLSVRKRNITSFLLRLLGTRVEKDGSVYVPWLYLPFPKGSVVDMVPVDHVVSTMLTLSKEKGAWGLGCFHLTQQDAPESFGVLRAAMEDIGIHGTKYVQVPPSVFQIILIILYYILYPLRVYTKSLFWYVPYVTRRHNFTHENTMKIRIYEPPEITRTFLHTINEYAEKHIFSEIRIEQLA